MVVITHGRDSENHFVSYRNDSEFCESVQIISLYSIDTYAHISEIFSKKFQYQGQIEKSLRIVLQKRLVNKLLATTKKSAVGDNELP
jgi:hypothetical protein